MIYALAGGWGRCIGRYSLARVNEGALATVMDAPVPPDPCIWLGWHECNLIAIAVHRRVVRRPAVALVPPGLPGATMRAWLDDLKVEAICLSSARRANSALKALRAALDRGCDVLMAADGPSGPRRDVKAGAQWLSHTTGVEIRPVGCAAAPAMRLPRWDRHLVPLPGARIAAVLGHRLHLEDDPRSNAAKTEVGRALTKLTDRAAAKLRPAARAAKRESKATRMGDAR